MRPPRVRTVVVFLILGLIVSVAVALALAVMVDVTAGRSVSAARGDWTVEVQWAAGSVRVSSARELPSWSPGQATGAPDTPGAGDFRTAWAAQTNGGSPEWLMLEFDPPVASPAFVDVYETDNPGALTRVTVVGEDGKETEAWRGDDPTPRGSGRGASHVPLSLPKGWSGAVRRVKLYVGRPDVPGWNEVDAVGLVEPGGTVHWASDATASSWYGQSSYGYSVAASGGGTDPTPLVPSWGGIRRPRKPAGGGGGNTSASQRQVVEARGWPMLALWTPVEEGYGPPMAAASGFSVSSGRLTLGVPVAPSPTSVRPNLPYRPIAIGLAIDAMFYGVILWLTWVTLTVPRRFFREVSRVRRGWCVQCGYDLGYDFVHGCPECGWRREKGAVREMGRRSTI